MTSQITSDSLFTQLLNELCIEISFRAFQKQMTINSVCPHCSQQCRVINEKPGLDIYGNKIDGGGGVIAAQSSSSLASTTVSETSSVNGMITVECPCCKKVLAATRFAPHLEKCMGMGRHSARKRGNMMMKMAAGSENESGDDASEQRTPAMQTIEDSFSHQSSASKSTANPPSVPVSANDAKKVKVSPMKAKPPAATSSASNSKATSPTKKKAAVAVVVTPSKSKMTKK